ncbi:MAG TPA: UbiA family prenyltransferase [Polyangiaceae bacterium]|nr:UbiA family prenyltransferase [Polyangiaceae bacterium]
MSSSTPSPSQSPAALEESVKPQRHRVLAVVAALRPHQWSKNALLLLPMVLAPSLPTLLSIERGLLAALTFSLCASAGYVLNDVLDIKADRAHPTKRRRPFASGELPVALGPFLVVLLVIVSFASSLLFVPFGFSVMLAIYLAGTLSYSFYFKRKLMVDVLLLAGLYTHRILAGGIATGVPVSSWLLGFSMFFFTSLAFAKRYVELQAASDNSQIKNRGYFPTDKEMVTSMGTGSGYIAALVFMLYVESAAVRVNYRAPSILWLIMPILLYWLGRVWLLAGRGHMQDDPVKFALRDLHSLICAVGIVLIALLARFTPAWISTLLH